MLSGEQYDKNINDILEYLNKYFREPEFEIKSGSNKIKYYTTKFFISLPKDVNDKLDEILWHEIQKYPIFDVEQIGDEQIYVHLGDITQIKADVIVNAANEDGLGCFTYDHKCVDNIIHNKAGPNLRAECNIILSGSKIKTSDAIITRGYNLPAKYVLHTVGPVYNKKIHDKSCLELSSCYSNCLGIADKYGFKSIVFCCISTGLYGFPQEEAAKIAIHSTKNYLRINGSKIKVIFCTFRDSDYELYTNLVHLL